MASAALSCARIRWVVPMYAFWPTLFGDGKTHLLFVIRIAIHFEGWLFAVSAHIEPALFEVTICVEGACSVSVELHSHWQHAIWSWHYCAFYGLNNEQRNRLKGEIRWIKWIIISSANIPALIENFLQTLELHFPNFENNNPIKNQSKC